MYRFWKNAVRGIDCDNIINEYENLALSEASVGSVDVIGANCSKHGVDTNVRDSKVNWLDANNALTRTIWSYILDANLLYFNYQLEGHESVQFTRYEKDEFYKWHTDSGGNFDEVDSKIENGTMTKMEGIRKLSASLQLSKPEDYEGCELEFYNGDNEPEKLPIKGQGTIIVFDSVSWHRITPAISGTRYSLVMWARGPRFQ